MRGAGAAALEVSGSGNWGGSMVSGRGPVGAVEWNAGTSVEEEVEWSMPGMELSCGSCANSAARDKASFGRDARDEACCGREMSTIAKIRRTVAAIRLLMRGMAWPSGPEVVAGIIVAQICGLGGTDRRYFPACTKFQTKTKARFAVVPSISERMNTCQDPSLRLPAAGGVGMTDGGAGLYTENSGLGFCVTQEVSCWGSM